MSVKEKQAEQGGRIAGLFVRRPVLAVVINSLIVVGGLAAFLGVEVRELPEVDQPVITINTQFAGAAADTVDREVTQAIEGGVARVQGVTDISSSSSYGRSQVTMTFADGTNLDAATSDVRDATARIVARFPDGVDPPTIVKADANASAIMQLSVTSQTLSRDDLTNLVDNQISEALSAVPGVADLQIYGEQAKVFTIDVDQNKLAAVGLTVAVYGFFPRAAAAVGWSFLGLCILLQELGPLLRLSHWITDVSPFAAIPRAPGVAIPAEPLLVTAGLGLVLTAAGLIGLRRRDIG